MKVIENVTFDRAYDFLLTFQTTMSVSRTFSEIDGDFSRKSQNFPTPCILRPRWRGCPWNWVPAPGIRKLEWWGYRVDKEVWRLLQPSGYNAPTWWMDGHRATANTTLTHSVARQKSDTADKPRDAFVQMQWRGCLPKPPLSHMCYRTEFGCSRSNHVRIS